MALAGRARAHAFVADVESPELGPDDRHHLERVLRLRPGDELTVADGAGRWRRCRFGPVVEVDGDVEVEPPPAPALTCLLVGPEGGWTDEELALAPARVALGPTVLRAETAAVAGAVLLAGLRAGLVATANLHSA